MIIRIMNIIAWASLILLVLPSILYLFDWMDLDTVKNLMIVATLIWFGAKVLVTYLGSKLSVNSES